MTDMHQQVTLRAGQGPSPPPNNVQHQPQTPAQGVNNHPFQNNQTSPQPNGNNKPFLISPLTANSPGDFGEPSGSSYRGSSNPLYSPVAGSSSSISQTNQHQSAHQAAMGGPSNGVSSNGTSNNLIRPMSRQSGPSPSTPINIVPQTSYQNHRHQQSASGSNAQPTPPSQSQPQRSPFTTPITSPPRSRPSQILLINPTSTRSMTEACLASVRPSLPSNVELTGYTAPYPAPSAIESNTDAIMSTEAVLRDLAKYATSNGETVQNYDGMIVACFSKHPLIDALRESYDVPVVGVMEASLYIARMLGGRFGVLTTTSRAKIIQEDAVAAYGLTHFYVGSEALHLGVLELGSRPREEVAKRVGHLSRTLANKGADTILLGSIAMTDCMRAAKDAVRDEDGRRLVNIIDGVDAGVQMITAMIGMSVPTSKIGLYKGEKDGRRARGQNWL